MAESRISSYVWGDGSRWIISFATADVRTSARAPAVMQLIGTDLWNLLDWIQFVMRSWGCPPHRMLAKLMAH